MGRSVAQPRPNDQKSCRVFLLVEEAPWRRHRNRPPHRPEWANERRSCRIVGLGVEVAQPVEEPAHAPSPRPPPSAPPHAARMPGKWRVDLMRPHGPSLGIDHSNRGRRRAGAALDLMIEHLDHSPVAAGLAGLHGAPFTFVNHSAKSGSSLADASLTTLASSGSGSAGAGSGGGSIKPYFLGASLAA